MATFECIAVFSVTLFFIFMILNRKLNIDAILRNLPMIGMLPVVLRNMWHIHDFSTSIMKHHGGTVRFKGPWLTNTNFIITSDPMNVNHITSKNFSNYGKGSNFHEIFEVLGGGIFNSDSHEWKKQRTTLHSIFKTNSFRILLRRTIAKKLQNCFLPFLDQASKIGANLDLQDIIERFTFDSTSTLIFGFDPHSLPSNFYELSELACEKSLPVFEDAVFYRHFTPTWLWKLQIWLQIGSEKKCKVARQKLDQFLYDCIKYSQREEHRSRCNEIEEVEEEDSHFNLLKALMKEEDGNGNGKGELMSDKYLRDVTINLLAAGNGTITASISWFLWLVSTHPLVEAKILQEIADNFPTKFQEEEEENWVPSSVEDLDKLIYLHAAICESLRLYPPVPFEHKCAFDSDTLPSGDRVDPNTKILYLLYSMGRMKQTWGEDCKEFKPERWISEKGSIIHMPSYKFIAFNAGPRSCLGKDISFIQMKMVSAAILRKFCIQVLEGHLITPRVSVVLSMKYGLKVRVTKR